MKIKNAKYRGFDYEIHFADKGDWRDKLNHFYTKSNNCFDGGFETTLDGVERNIKASIDAFLSNQPNTIDELLDRIESDCFVWTGYELCELDRKSARILIESFINMSNSKVGAA